MYIRLHPPRLPVFLFKLQKAHYANQIRCRQLDNGAPNNASLKENIENDARIEFAKQQFGSKIASLSDPAAIDAEIVQYTFITFRTLLEIM